MMNDKKFSFGRRRHSSGAFLIGFARALFLSLFLLCGTATAEIELRATLLEKSPTPTKEERGAYLEGLVNYLYEVNEVMKGELDQERILVSHYAVFDDKEQDITSRKVGEKVRLKVKPFDAVPSIQEIYLSDNWDLDFVLTRYHDVDQNLERRKPPKRRFDYGDSGRESALAPLVGLRNQLRVVASGDSQTWHGISPAALFPTESPFVAVTHNAANPSSRLPWTIIVAEDYLVDMPDLELFIMGINPRMFKEGKSDLELHPVRNTPGYRADMELAENGWRLPWDLVDGFERDQILPNGYELRSIPGLGTLKAPDGKQRREIKRTVEQRLDRRYEDGDEAPESYRIDPKAQARFEQMLERTADRGFDILAFKPPISPVVLDYPGIIDEDRTTPEGYDRLVAYLESLEDRFPHFHFIDIDRKARHFLKIEHFHDTDHTNDLGGAMLTSYIEALRPKGEAPRMEARVEGRTVSLKSNAADARWVLSDETVLVGQEVTHTFEKPGTYWVGVSGKVRGSDRAGVNWTEVAVEEEEAEMDRWERPEPVLQVHEGRDIPEVRFFNATQSDNAVMAVWDFGDGNQGAGFFVQHTYQRPGRYEVTLTVYNEEGGKESMTETIRIRR